MQAAVDELSWIERFYPSNIASGMAGGLDSVSEWLKSSRTEGSAKPAQYSSSSTKLESAQSART